MLRGQVVLGIFPNEAFPLCRHRVFQTSDGVTRLFAMPFDQDRSMLQVARARALARAHARARTLLRPCFSLPPFLSLSLSPPPSSSLSLSLPLSLSVF